MAGRLVLGTRGSALALWQARHVAGALRRRHPGLEIEERVLRTEGDDDLSRPIRAGDRGVFVRRIEQALLDGEIDLAVHSLKDLPTTQPDGLTIAAVPPRHDPRDVLLTIEPSTVESLPREATVATGSPRRRTQLWAVRDDLKMVGIRGNVDSRVRQLREGRFSALVLALAGIERLGIESVSKFPIPVETCLPAVGQGALAIEARTEDGGTRDLVGVLEHAESRITVESERAFLRVLGGGCLAPAACHAQLAGDGVSLDAVVAGPDGRRILRDRETGTASEALVLGERLARRLLDSGAGELLREARREADRDG